MNKIIYCITFTFFCAASSFAQLKLEEINLNNGVIQLPGTLTYTYDKSPLIIWVHGSGGVDRNGSPANYSLKKFQFLNCIIQM